MGPFGVENSESSELILAAAVSKNIALKACGSACYGAIDYRRASLLEISFFDQEFLEAALIFAEWREFIL